MDLVIDHPERWWVATEADMPLLDKVVEERHHEPPLEARDWREIAQAMSSVARQLGDLLEGAGPLTVSIDTSSPAVAEVLMGWVDIKKVVTGDPHENGITSDGRHRLRYCWDQAPEATLPVHCATLLFEDQARDDDVVQGIMVDALRPVESALEPEHVRRTPRFASHVRLLLRSP